MSARHLEPVFIGPGGSPGPILAEHVGLKAAGWKGDAGNRGRPARSEVAAST